MALLRQAGLRRGRNDLDDDQTRTLGSICGCSVLEVSPWRRWLLKSRRAKGLRIEPLSQPATNTARRQFSGARPLSVLETIPWTFMRFGCTFVQFACTLLRFGCTLLPFIGALMNAVFGTKRRLEMGLNDTRTVT